MTVSWDVTPCNLINICHSSEETCFIRQDGGRRLLRNAEKIYQTTRCHIPKNSFFKQWSAMARSFNGRPVLRTPSFNPRPVRAGVMVDKVALGWVFFLIFRLSRVRIILAMSHTHPSITDATESSYLTALLNNKHSRYICRACSVILSIQVLVPSLLHTWLSSS